ncbi:MAG: hypothetical protein KF788_10980 [Piscinibacter sp.]|nr:hypothetical protein [Piscinibacter sp.]
MASFVERVLILCKTYPSPSAKYAETSCVAGLTAGGKLVRLFPVPFRLVADEQQFRKWQWIDVRLEKSRDDHRPESHRIFVDTIVCDAEPMKAGKHGWPARMAVLAQQPVFTDFEAMEQARQAAGTTLALFKPARITSLEIKATKNADWTADERSKLLQMQQQNSLFDAEEDQRQVRLLEKIPFDFYYHCEYGPVDATKSVRVKLVDWEACALYRNARRQHGRHWEAPFRDKLERDLLSKDLMLLMGTIHRFPDQWLGVSLIYPPKPQPEDPSQSTFF